jgi:alanyl-tRNA synthetase
MLQVDEIVNEVIAKDMTIYAQEVPLAQGRAVNGLTAVFGEKYPDPGVCVCATCCVVYLYACACVCGLSTCSYVRAQCAW